MAETNVRWRYPLMLLAALALLAALWGGWVRLGWAWPFHPTLTLGHGPLMVSGFLGTLIGVERAVALRKRWPYISPLLCGLGGLLLLLGTRSSTAGQLAALLITLGSLGLVAVFVSIVQQHRALYTMTMASGAVTWFVGNLLWLLGWSIPSIVLWWGAFLVLTVAGERLELGRLSRLPRSAETLFWVAVGPYLLGLVVSLANLGLGTRLSGAGLVALGAWLLRYDIARFTIRQKGMPRYAAVCLLSGYVWLIVGGLIGVLSGALVAGLRYDAFLHAIFLGFVFSMIFGHAPIIFPAILRFPLSFHTFITCRWLCCTHRWRCAWQAI